MTEIELKFLLEEGHSGEIWARLKASDIVSGARSTRTLRSLYLDTADRALKQAGIALRLRRDGRRWLQTVKIGGRPHGGLSQPIEIEHPAPGGKLCLAAIPDAKVRAMIAECTGGAPLGPVCETLVTRTTSELTLRDGTRAELAVDVGEIRAGGRSAALSELEIELLTGSPAALYDVARVTLPDGGLRFSRLSKAARGYMLADEGRIDLPFTPRNARAIALEPTRTSEQAARDILRECLDQIASNVLAARRLPDEEAPRQLWLALRRLLAAFSVLAPLIEGAEAARLGIEARWLGHQVEQPSGRDVAAGDMAGPDVLAREAQERRQSRCKLLAGRRVQLFLIDLARFVETGGWLSPRKRDRVRRLAMPVADFSSEALDRCWGAVAGRLRGPEAITAEELAEWRGAAEELRYAVEFFSSLFPTRQVGPFLKRLEALEALAGGGAKTALGRKRAGALWRSLQRASLFWR